MRGRPRVAAWAESTRHGRLYLRIRPPQARRVEVRVPDGWDAATTFAAWLRDWTDAHPTTPLPGEWRCYVTAAGQAPALPGRYCAPGTHRGARAAVARTVAALAPPPALGRPWATAVAAHLAAIRAGWHCPGARGGAHRPDYIRARGNRLLWLGRHGRWTSTAQLARGAIHELIRRLERGDGLRRPYAHNGICKQLTTLRTFAVWCEQQVPPLCAPVARADWPVYPREHRRREARATTGDLDRLAALVPRWLHPGRPPSARATRRRTPGVPLRALVLLMRYLGLRHLGAARLPRAAFVLDGDEPHVVIASHQDKAGHPGTLPLPAPLLAELRAVFTEHSYAPAELPWGAYRPDGSIIKRPTLKVWNRYCDRAGVPRNLDGTRGFHRARKAFMDAVLQSPSLPGGAGAYDAWRVRRDLCRVTSYQLDTYLGTSTIRDLQAAQPGAPRTAAPVQLEFHWRRSYVDVRVSDEDGVAQRARLPLTGEVSHRLLRLVGDVRALAVDEPQSRQAAQPVTIPDLCSTSASSASPRRSTAGIPRRVSVSGVRRMASPSRRSRPAGRTS